MATACHKCRGMWLFCRNCFWVWWWYWICWWSVWCNRHNAGRLR